MNQPIDSTFIPFPTPSAAAPHTAGGQAPTANGAHQTAHRAEAITAGGAHGGADPAEHSPGGSAKRGRPSGCSDRVVAMMKDQIRRHGFSDTAAAESVGVSSTSISRWKKQDPELASELLKARFDCRIYHLEIIENAAAAENGRGWRASAWILERLFPGDYAPKMAERFAYLHLQDKLQDREESARVYEDVQIRLAEEKAQRARAAAAAAEAELEEARAPEGAGAARSREAGLGGEPPPLRGGVTPPPAEASCIYSGGDSRNSRNSGAAEPDRGPHTPCAAPGTAHSGCGFTRPHSGLCGPRGAVEEAAGSDVRPGSLNEVATGAASSIYSEDDSRNSRNSNTAEPGAGEVAASSEGRPDSLNQAAMAAGSCIYSEGDSHNSRNCPMPPPAAHPGLEGARSPSPSPLPPVHMPTPRPSRTAEATNAALH